MIPMWAIAISAAAALLLGSPILRSLAVALRVDDPNVDVGQGSGSPFFARWGPGLTVACAAIAAGTLTANLPAFAALTLGSAVLVVVALVDLAERRIPDLVTYPLTAVCAMAAVVSPFTSTAAQGRSAIVGGLGFLFVLGAVHLARPAAMGLGDVKLAFPLGFGIGWVTADAIAAVAAIGWTLIGASVIGLLMAARHPASADNGLRYRSVPFGPALSMASACTIAVTLS